MIKEVQLKEIISECLIRGIRVENTLGPKKQMAYEIHGFSKSGIATVYVGEERIICETRYNTMDEIDTFHDLSLIAFEWYLNYRNRPPFEEPDYHWAEYWVEKGMMSKTTKVVYSTR